MANENKIDFTQYPDYKVDLDDWYFDTSFGPYSHAPTNLVEQEYGKYAGTMVSPQFATDKGGKPMFTEYLSEHADLVPLRNATSYSDHFFNEQGGYLNPGQWLDLKSGKYAYEPGLTSERPFSPGNTMRTYVNPDTGRVEEAAYYPPMLNPRASGEHGWAPNAAVQSAILKQMENPIPIKDMTKGYFDEKNKIGDPVRSTVAGTYWHPDAKYPSGIVGLNLDNLGRKNKANIQSTLGHELGMHGQEADFNKNIEGLSEGLTLNPSHWANESSDVIPGSPEYEQIISDMLAEHKAKNKMGILQSWKENIFGGGNPPFPKYVEESSTRHWPTYARDAMHYPKYSRANYLDKGFPMTQQSASDDLKIQNYSGAMHDKLLQPRTDRILDDLNASFPHTPSRPSISDVAGSVRRDPVTTPTPRTAQVGPPGYDYNTGGLVSLVW